MAKPLGVFKTYNGFVRTFVQHYEATNTSIIMARDVERERGGGEVNAGYLLKSQLLVLWWCSRTQGLALQPGQPQSLAGLSSNLVSSVSSYLSLWDCRQAWAAIFILEAKLRITAKPSWTNFHQPRTVFKELTA